MQIECEAFLENCNAICFLKTQLFFIDFHEFSLYYNLNFKKFYFKLFFDTVSCQQKTGFILGLVMLKYYNECISNSPSHLSFNFCDSSCRTRSFESGGD